MSLRDGAETIVDQCLNIQQDENVLVLNDGNDQDLIDSLLEVLEDENIEHELIEYPEPEEHGEEPPEEVAERMKQTDVIIAPTKKSLSHTEARKEANRSGEGLKQLERGAREFRKWGVGMVLLSQVISDFSGEIRANIGTTVQMRTQYEKDLDRLKDKFGMDTVKSVAKAEVGSGMLQNSDYNHGRPYFVDFRPLLHSPHRLSDEELDKYEHYNKRIEGLKQQIDRLEEQGEEVYEYRSELKLAKKNLKKGSFNLVDIYLDELEQNLG